MRGYGYEVQGIPSPGVLLISSSEWGVQIWNRARMRTHKTSPCAICGVEVGVEAYRPVTNLSNRMHRICLRHEGGAGVVSEG